MLQSVPARYADLPAGRRAAILAGLTVLFLLFAWSSRLDPLLGTAGCAGLAAVTALVVPQLGIALLVVYTPVRALFDLSQERMQLVLAAGLLAAAATHLPLLVRFARERQPRVLLVFAAFLAVFVLRTTLEVVQFGTSDPWGLANEALFFASLLTVALAAHAHAQDRRFAGDLLVAVGLAVALTIAIDAFDLYFPMTAESLGLHKGVPVFRLAGLHVNPNATGKYLVFGALLACCALWVARDRIRIALGLLSVAIVTLAIAATLSKGALLAVFGALLAYALHEAWRRRWRRVGTIAATILLVLGAVATWYAAVAPWTYTRAIRTLVEMKRLPVEAQAQAQRTFGQSIAEFVENELGLSTSRSIKMTAAPRTGTPDSEAYRKIPGAIEYTPRDCTWSCTGQRDRLWRTGLGIVSDHWVLGIGPHRWADEYMARLQFPFDTPHDGLLELWGGYGLAGAALYLAVVISLLRLAGRSFRIEPSAPDFVFLVGTSLYAIAMLLTELVDPAKFLSMNPHAIWLWVFTAAQAGVLGRMKEYRRASP